MPVLLAQFKLPADASTWFILTGGIITLVYFYLRKSGAKKRGDPLTNHGAKMSLAQQRSTERQMESLLVELSEMARQVGAQLDTRSAKLEELIRQADDRLAQLRNEIPGSIPSSASSSRTEDDPAFKAMERELAAAASALEAARHQSQLHNPRPRAAPTVPEINANEAFEPRRPDAFRTAPDLEVPNPQDRRYADVYRLADQGRAAPDIANLLDRPVGEIQLILALRPKG